MSLKSYKTIFEKQEKKASHHSPGWNRGPGSVRGRHDILRAGSGYLSGHVRSLTAPFGLFGDALGGKAAQGGLRATTEIKAPGMCARVHIRYMHTWEHTRARTNTHTQM